MTLTSDGINNMLVSFFWLQSFGVLTPWVIEMLIQNDFISSVPKRAISFLVRKQNAPDKVIIS